MNYRNPQLRDKLAAEYVLGTLRGRARARFDGLLKYDPALRQLVAEWEARLTPLAAAAGEITPPARVWKNIAARIGAGGGKTGWWTSLALWRGLAATGTTLALALALYLGAAPAPEPPLAMVAVMTDELSQPAMVVSWPHQQSLREPHVRIRIVQDHPTMANNTSWELWMLPDPAGKAPPVSLGLVGLEPNQVLKLNPAQARKINDAWSLALTIEPPNGSPTGAPTGPVIFKGRSVKVI